MAIRQSDTKQDTEDNDKLWELSETNDSNSESTSSESGNSTGVESGSSNGSRSGSSLGSMDQTNTDSSM